MTVERGAAEGQWQSWIERIGAAWSQRLHLISAWNRFFADFDVLLTPTWTQLPFVHGADASPNGAAATIELARPVLPANVLGFPAACVPATLVYGLPVGMMLTGPAWSDLTCLRVAADIEVRNDVQPTPIDPKVPAHG